MGFEVMIQDYNAFEPGMKVSLLIKPQEIQVMKKERLFNTVDGTMIDATHVEMLGGTFECAPVQGIEGGEAVDVRFDFDKAELMDDIEEGTIEGDVRFILYKGNHYHLTVRTESGDNIYVNTQDVYDERDIGGIRILPEDIRITVKK